MKIFLQAARPVLSDLLSTLVFAGVAALSRRHAARAGGCASAGGVSA